jgi:hypothetical protein
MVEFSVKCTYWAKLLVRRSRECNEDFKFWRRMNDGACEEKKITTQTRSRKQSKLVSHVSRVKLLLVTDKVYTQAHDRKSVCRAKTAGLQEPGLQAHGSQDCRLAGAKTAGLRIVECDCRPRRQGCRLTSLHFPPFSRESSSP